jgi:hypothetical protein
MVVHQHARLVVADFTFWRRENSVMVAVVGRRGRQVINKLIRVA